MLKPGWLFTEFTLSDTETSSCTSVLILVRLYTLFQKPEASMESRHCGQDKRIFFCPVHNASTPCSLQAFGIRCMHQSTRRTLLEIAVYLP